MLHKGHWELGSLENRKIPRGRLIERGEIRTYNKVCMVRKKKGRPGFDCKSLC